MKKIFSLAVVLAVISLSSFTVSAQADKHPQAPAHREVQKDNWKESSDFHSVMAATFHPAEDGNFKPVRERASELVTKAEAWLNSTPPADMNRPEIKAKLKTLVAEATAVKNLVDKKASDDDLKKQLSTLHDTFHTIIGMCRHDHEEDKK